MSDYMRLDKGIILNRFKVSFITNGIYTEPILHEVSVFNKSDGITPGQLKTTMELTNGADQYVGISISAQAQASRLYGKKIMTNFITIQQGSLRIVKNGDSRVNVLGDVEYPNFINLCDFVFVSTYAFDRYWSKPRDFIWSIAPATLVRHKLKGYHDD